MAGITIVQFSKSLTASLDSHRFDRSALQVSFRVLQRSALAMTCSVLICRGAGYLAISFFALVSDQLAETTPEQCFPCL
jgi:hypothetical protein